jgi:hypothetical protein
VGGRLFRKVVMRGREEEKEQDSLKWGGFSGGGAHRPSFLFTFLPSSFHFNSFTFIRRPAFLCLPSFLHFPSHSFHLPNEKGEGA